MKLGNITQKFKKRIYKRSILYSNPTVNLMMDGESLIVSCSIDKYSDKFSVVIQHRLTKNSIEKNIKSGRVIFSLDEISNLGSIGFFDFYFRLESELIRIKKGSKADIKQKFDDKNYILESYTTKYGNLSLNLEKTDFDNIIDSINVNDDDITFVGNFDFIRNEENTEFYIEVKNRKTGKRLEEIIKSNQVTFSLDEILSLDESSYFDIFFKSRNESNLDKKRIKYNHDFQFFKAISNKRNKILKIVSTSKNNLSFKQEDKCLDCNISSLDNDNNNLLIKGDFEVFDNEIKNIDNVVVVAKNRVNQEKILWDVDFKQIDNDLKYSFESTIGEFYSDEKIVNLRLDFYLRVYDGEIYYQELIDLNNFTSYKNKENRFLVNINLKDNVYSYYATENKHSLALWITTETSWQKSYEVTKGKTIYDNTVAENDLDENIVFFESFFGKAYSGNPKYIYETMLEMGLDDKYTFVWAYSGDDKEEIPGNPIIVDRYKAGDYYKYLALAKYWVNNIIFPIHKKRNGNIYLQTWHGTPLKKLGYDITIPGPEVDARRNFYKESRNWDYLISSNNYSSKIFKRAFKFEKEVLELGYPINDIFFKDNTDLINSLKSKLHLESNKKIILYAPTWKDDEQNESWEHYFNLEIDLERLYKEFGDEYIVLLKMHHLVSENLRIDDKLKEFAIDVSGWEDIQELYVASDILITDYSSVFFDYAHSKRPILFFVPDLEHYISNVRGLYLNMKKDLPGPIIKDNDELVDVIKNIDDIQIKYSKKYDEFYDEFCSLCKGQSAREIIEKVFD